MNRPKFDRKWVARLAGFRPAWWLPGGHAQTLSAAYWPGPQALERGVARSIVLPDGDALVALDDCPPEWRAGDPAALMMHGLSGSARNAFLVRTASKLVRRGVRVFRLNLRGCGAGVGLARLPYNAGRSGDLQAAVLAVIEWCREPAGLGEIDLPLPHHRQEPGDNPAVRERAGVRGLQQDASARHHETPLTLFGMSLSGNLLLKYLGEEGDQVPPAVRRAIAVNPPIDLARSVRTLERPLNRGYDRHFVQALIEHVKTQAQLRSDFAALPTPLPRSLYDFDDRFTAPHGGYPDAAAYYRDASAQTRIAAIRVPTLILTSADDPLVPIEMFEEQRGHWPDSVQLVITRSGGHLGYVGSGHGDPDSRWLDWRVVEFVLPSPSP